MMNHKGPQRPWIMDRFNLERLKGQTWNVPRNFDDTFEGKCPASKAADNKVEHLYWSYDLKVNLPDGKDDPGTGGGASQGFAPKVEYDEILHQMVDVEVAAWKAHFDPLSDDFLKKDLHGDALKNECF